MRAQMCSTAVIQICPRLDRQGWGWEGDRGWGVGGGKKQAVLYNYKLQQLSDVAHEQMLSNYPCDNWEDYYDLTTRSNCHFLSLMPRI